MVTSIQISDELRNFLAKRKMYDKETYEEVIWNLVEDNMKLSEETLAHLKEAENDIKSGRVYTPNEIKKELGL